MVIEVWVILFLFLCILTCFLNWNIFNSKMLTNKIQKVKLRSEIYLGMPMSYVILIMVIISSLFD